MSQRRRESSRTARKTRTANTAQPTRKPSTNAVTDTSLAVVVVGVFLLAGWLDRDGCVQAQQAAIFSAIWAAISWLGNVLGFIGSGIATTVEAAVVYLSSAVGWLASRVASIVLSTGSMFARVWEWARQAYDAVIKPALVWLHDVYTRVTGWLGNFFRPVFDFLSHVRTILMDIYARFIRPILTGLDIAHAILKTLADLHVQWAATLDAWVQDAQRLITENFLKILGYVNEIRDVVNSVVTPDRLFARVPLLATLNRDAGYWARIFWNSQITPYLKPRLPSTPVDVPPGIPPEQLGAELGAFYINGSGAFAAAISDAASVYHVAAGETTA